ncbi:MAG: ankyrin repeat domain-containing protein [Breznakibacter sp.]
MNKSLFAKLLVLITLFMIVGGSVLSAQKKKSKKEQKEELNQKVRLEKAQADLANGADPNRKDGKMTWLGIELQEYNRNGQYPEITKLLINAKGIKLNEWNIYVQPEVSWKYTALMDAVAFPEIVTLLLDKGALVDLQDDWIEWDGKLKEIGGNTALMLAIGQAGSTHTESAKLLLAKGAKMDIQDKLGNTALMDAVHNTEIAKILIDKGAKIDLQNHGGETALMLAACKYPEVVKLLLDKGANILLRQDAKHNFTPNALDRAAINGNIESAKLILAKAKSLGVKDEVIRVSLHWAVVSNQLEMAKYLLDEGANVEGNDDYAGYTPLMETSMFEMVELLVGRGANVNAKNKMNSTPLHKAVFNYQGADNKEKDCDKILNLLLVKGANVDAQDNHGITPLMGAVQKMSPTKILVDKGAKLNIQNNNGETALMYAVKGGLLRVLIVVPVIGSYTEAAKLLLGKGADVNLQDKWGKTALMHAAGAANVQGDNYNSYTDMLTLLIDNGAALETKDKEGFTALYWAQRFGRYKSAELLIAKGANPANKYDKATDKSNVKAGIVGTWINTFSMQQGNTKVNITNKVIFKADWTYSKVMIASGQTIPDGGRYNTYDLRDGRIWLFNDLGTNAVLEYRFEGKTLILNGEKYTKSVK